MKKVYHSLRSRLTGNGLLIENFSYLSVLQVFNLLLPLVTYPYLIRILGDELFGRVIFAQAIVLYLSVVISYGFNISGVKDVAVSRQDKAKLNEIASVIIFTKTALFLIILVLYLFAVFLIPFLRKDSLLYIVFYIFCIGEILFPIWFFQGFEKLKYVTFVNLVSKLSFTLLVFLLIKKKSDYLLFPLFLSLGNTVGGLFGFLIMKYSYQVKMYIPGASVVKKYFRNSTPLFLSRVTDSILERGLTIIIGTFVGMAAVTRFDIASKIIYVFTLPFMILNQVLYPKIASEKKFRFLKRVILLSIPASILADLVMIITGSYLIRIIGGKGMEDAVTVLYILSPLVIINSMIYLLGSPTLIAAGYSIEFSRSISFSLMFSVLLIIPLVLINPANLFAYILITRILTNLSILLLRLYYTHKNKIFRNDSTG